MTGKKPAARKASKKTPTAKAARSGAQRSLPHPSDRRHARRVLGRARADGEALFPVPPPKSELPTGYAEALQKLKKVIQQTRLRTVFAANTAMLRLYWEVGRTILDRQARQGWGAKVIDRLSHDLREAFPDMAGLSPRNLKYMRAFGPTGRLCKLPLHN